MTQARERRTSKNLVSNSRHASSLVCNAPRRFPLSATYLFRNSILFSGFGSGGRAYINSQHVAEPQILAYALMHHLLMQTAAARIAGVGPYRQILVAELAPHTDHFQPLCVVAFYEKRISHSVDVTGDAPLALSLFCETESLVEC